MRKSTLVILMTLISAVLMSVSFTTAAIAQAEPTVSGVLSVVYGDSPTNPLTLFYLNTPDGRRIPLNIPPDVMGAAGGITALMGAQVSVTLDSRRPSVLSSNVTYTAHSLTIQALQPRQPLNGGASGGVASAGGAAPNEITLGGQTWLNLLCKFSGNDDEPHTPAKVSSFFSNTSPFIGDFFQQESYSLMSISSVTTTSNWLTLPHTVSYYLGLPLIDALSQLFDDCTALHTNSVTFADYYGINIFLNGAFNGYFMGMSCQDKSLQGQPSHCWRATWLPFYGFPDLRAFAHEMGHGYGLAHSNNSDGDGDPYDNGYDVMSGFFPCRMYTSAYACQQSDTIGYQKDQLGWISDANQIDITSNGIFPITLDRLSKATSSNTYVAYIPLSATHSISIESRRNDFNEYDNTVFHSGVVLFDIDLTHGEPAWQIGAISDGAAIEGPGVFEPGETYTDYVNGFAVTVNNPTSDGYDVTLYKGSLGAAPDLAVSVQSVTNGVGKSDVVARVQNNGSGMATHAYLAVDTNPNFFLNAISPVSICHQIPTFVIRSMLCELGDIAPGAYVDVPLDVRPSIPVATTIPLRVVSNENEINKVNNKVNASVVPVTLMGDAVINITSDYASTQIGTVIHYQAKLQNVGGAAITGITYTFTLPAGMTYDNNSVITSKGAVTGLACGGSGGPGDIVCTIGSLGPASGNSYVTLKFNGHGTTAGAKIITAHATVTNSEINTGNNAASLLTLIGSPATVNGTLAFPGRPSPSSTQLVDHFALTVTHVNTGIVAQNVTAVTNADGVFTVTGLTTAEDFKFRLKGENSLSIVQTVTPLGAVNDLDFGSLKFGDANNDNIINISDFSLLAFSFGKVYGTVGYEGRADFNGDNTVNIQDFSLLASNFGQAGQD